MLTATDILNAIASGQLDDHLSDIGLACNRRYRARGRENRSAFAVGDEVILSGLTPQYINGHRATITAIHQSKATVALTDGPVGRFQGDALRVPFGCLTLA